MENPEQNRKPELHSDALLALIDTLQWKSYFSFSFNRTNYVLIIKDTETVARGRAGASAEYFRSTAINGWDIYLHDTIPSPDRKRILFHEIMEINLRDQGFDQQEAHQVTLVEEEKQFGPRSLMTKV